MIGLTRGLMEVVSYNPAWPDLLKQERDTLIKILGKHNYNHIPS